ncbi:cell division suppressor protein YneA [Bacillus sp. SD088]|uniref:cell division suppressor protein YneA n=1 Tax=Bacillus sp. SD088 TaxID=2782012 RepID=UPI001A961969|nr:LysM peptidoglycan-binding domain-containing protein [Bacillus sp. SD088]MBO0993030.1 LysM peptidoglycan-binding domain-containing protein [Bacillus sp. SD088]
MITLWRKYSFIIVFIFITFLMGIYIISSKTSSEQTHLTVTVQEGDSLWSISKKYAEEYGISTAQFVKIIEKENQLYGKVIKSGEQLVIPGEYIHSSPSQLKMALKEE